MPDNTDNLLSAEREGHRGRPAEAIPLMAKVIAAQGRELQVLKTELSLLRRGELAAERDAVWAHEAVAALEFGEIPALPALRYAVKAARFTPCPATLTASGKLRCHELFACSVDFLAGCGKSLHAAHSPTPSRQLHRAAQVAALLPPLKGAASPHRRRADTEPVDFPSRRACCLSGAAIRRLWENRRRGP